ncbi:hypothetical protein SNE40_012294 [Patella caerulea]|uniref:Uncharacterized protein n=1 Tax=Patella caerulea TaxID=87958 RepID=A0AAN8JPL5_PATCE
MHAINEYDSNLDYSEHLCPIPPASDEFKRALRQLRTEERVSLQSLKGANSYSVHSVDSLPAAHLAMGKIESRSLYEEEDFHNPTVTITNGHPGHVNVKNSVSYNGKYKDGFGETPKDKEKPKVKKLITSRSPRLNDHSGHHTVMHAQFRDSNLFTDEFRRRSMSESHAQMRRKALERQEKRNARFEQGGSGDIPHVHWADSMGDSLTSDLRRRSFSHGSTGLPNKPILKKITNGVASDSKCCVEHSNLLAVDTRYI